MTHQERMRELARYAQGQPSKVVNHASFGTLNGNMVQKSYGDVVHQGDRIRVVDGMIFKNGSYQGRVK
jgi:hypothetical protein